MVFLPTFRPLIIIMEEHIIGRKIEKGILEEALQSHEAEFVAVIGRRRVGKTFLIKQTYRKAIAFEITGLPNVSNQQQLQHFAFTLAQYEQAEKHINPPENWLVAFQQLISFLKDKVGSERRVVFLDELPWLASNRSDFLAGLSFFWNSWAVNQNLVVAVCGSAASWMIQKVVHNTGGLYNRITRRIFLQAFNLAETEAFLKSRHIHFTQQQIAELYMALGGIPHYLKAVKAGKSAVQNIDDICFSPQGLLANEFEQLYPALFTHAERHLAVIRVLGKKRLGLTRTQLLKDSKLPEGGNATKVLEELEHSGFISSYFPFGKKNKGKIFRLTDEYSLFYLQFIERNTHEGSGTWQHISQTQAYKSWSGYAFENLCFKHIAQVKKALGIGGVYARTSSFFQPASQELPGTQIDLLIDRNDKVVNLCEIKFHDALFALNAAGAAALREKTRIFREATQTKKHIMVTLITVFGIKTTPHSLGLVEVSVVLSDLFDSV